MVRDPLEGFIEYVKNVKPYHTKILEIIVEYQYSDIVNITISEKLSMDIHLNFSENTLITIPENYYFNVDKLELQDFVKVYVADNTYNIGWGVIEWDINGWSMPSETFMHITQNIIENVNVPITDNHSIVTEFNNMDVPVIIQDSISFIGASHPTLYLSDTVGVSVDETLGAVVDGGSISSFDYNYWDIGGYDEDMNTLVNLYGQAFPPGP